MSRFKLFLLLLIVAALSIVLIQNREPLSLQLLCADDTRACWYQTPQLPLAVWMSLFTLIGVIISFLSQALNRYSYSNPGRSKYVIDDELYPRDLDKRESSTQIEDSIILDKPPNTTNYEVQQEPQNVERSGSTYSYKYREASDRPKEQNNLQDRTVESEGNSRVVPEDDEDWI